MKKIVIVGAGGFGREILGIISDLKSYEVVGFLDVNPELKSRLVDNVPVIGGDEDLDRCKRQGVECVFVAVADSRLRRKLATICRDVGFEMPNLIHPMSYVAPRTMDGHGCAVYPGAVIMHGCRIFSGVLINSGVTIGHDTVVEGYCNINPGTNVAGKVRINEGAFIGIGTSIKEAIKIGKYSVVGAGAVVISDVPEGSAVVGVPARPINHKG